MSQNGKEAHFFFSLFSMLLFALLCFVSFSFLSGIASCPEESANFCFTMVRKESSMCFCFVLTLHCFYVVFIFFGDFSFSSCCLLLVYLFEFGCFGCMFVRTKSFFFTFLHIFYSFIHRCHGPCAQQEAAGAKEALSQRGPPR